MGIEPEEILDDRQIEEHIRMAQEQIKDTLFTYHYDETIGNNPDTGNSWNGTNTKYQTFGYPVMDSNYDFTVDSNDITAKWLDTNYTEQIASISVSSATYGIVTIYQSDGSTAIPSSAETVKVDYYSCHRNISKQQLENLTTWLACDFVMHSLKAGTSVSAADIMANKKIIMQDPDQYMNKYQDLLNQLQDSTIKGV